MLAVALCLSAIAEFYSIAGLAAIFAGAPISIIVMGVILGTSKLTITAWLHEFWNQAKLVMKICLVSAVLVLMFLTSMGVFGYLSKAHIEQVGAGQENAAQIQRITVELQRQTDIVKSAEAKVKTLETNGTGADANVQSQINQEQQRIDSAYSRVQPAIDDQQRIVDAQTKIYQDQITKIDQQLAQLQQYQDAKEVDRVQSLVGIKADGDWGSGTARAVTTWKNTRASERTAAVLKLEEANTNSTIKSARDEILRIRKGVETQIAESNKLIDRLRNQLGKGDTSSVETLVNEQQEKIKSANAEIETLTKQKYTLEVEYRKLEVEVGPIKYIADLIYGDNSDKNMLERAVRWVIMLIVAVFDPLAVMMLLAAAESMKWVRQRLPKPKDPIEESEPEKVDAVTQIYDEIQHEMMNKLVDENNKLREDSELLNKVLEEIEDERNKLFLAHSEEMKRADELAVVIDELTADYDDPILSSDGSDTNLSIELLPKETSKVELVNVKIISTSEIVTDGVTEKSNLFHPSEGYVNFDGKSMSIEVLRQLRPGLILNENDPINRIMFGSKFPEFARVGDIYIRVDTLPHTALKFNGKKWISIDKDNNGSYLQYIPYIQYLIQKIESGEYDAELLTDNERDEIANHLRQK